MLKYFMKCIYCNCEKLYKIKSGQLKCSKCKKKFSPTKIQKDMDLIVCFCQNFPASQSAKKLGINYVTAKKKYDLFRKLIANYLELEYKDKNVIEYDEYIYLQKSKKTIKENIFDAQNFLTFHYTNKVYNLIMPNLKRYKNQFLDDDAAKAYFKEFSKYMMFNKISKTQRRDNIITKFWNFFEESILKYKGVDDKNFFYYLKEIEFKFNYSYEEQKKILLRLYYS
jgi:hypothetical protein